MEFTDIQQCDKTFVAGTYGRHEVAFVSGKDRTLVDAEGKSYLDFASGIGVMSLGYGDADWTKAVAGQAEKLAHASNLFYTEPCGKVAKKLCSLTGAKKVFFGNSGAEANEGMIKAARKYSFDRYGRGRDIILTLQNSFHGRTITTLEATGQESFHQFFFPFTEGFRYVPANDTKEALKALKAGDVCAIMMESVQGEGGVMPLEEDFVKAVAKEANKRDILVLFDEVQTGVGRTGTFLGCQHFDVTPDLVSMAKGLGGGLPIGAVLFYEKTENVLGPSQHGSTFGGNPVVCAGAEVVLQKVGADDFLAEVEKKGEELREELSHLSDSRILEVRGKGLMIGLALCESLSAKELCAALLKEGLVTLTAGQNTLRLLPPLTITKEEITTGVSIIKNTLAKR